MNLKQGLKSGSVTTIVAGGGMKKTTTAIELINQQLIKTEGDILFFTKDTVEDLVGKINLNANSRIHIYSFKRITIEQIEIIASEFDNLSTIVIDDFTNVITAQSNSPTNLGRKVFVAGELAKRLNKALVLIMTAIVKPSGSSKIIYSINKNYFEDSSAMLTISPLDDGNTQVIVEKDRYGTFE